MKRVTGGRTLSTICLCAVMFVLFTAETCTDGDTTTKTWVNEDGNTWIGIWCDGSNVHFSNPDDIQKCWKKNPDVKQFSYQIGCKYGPEPHQFRTLRCR